MNAIQMTWKVSLASLVLVLGMFVMSTTPVYAQYSDGCDLCGGSYYDTSWDTGGGYYDTSWDTGGGYYDTSWDNGGGYYDTSWDTGGGYYDTSWDNGGGYYDTSWDNGGGYYDTSWDTGGGYYDTSWNNGGYTASPIYGGNTATPIYSYGTPSYGGIGGFGGYSTGGGYYVDHTPIPTWPTMPRYTATPTYSNTYVDRTTTPTWPSTTHVTATATGGNANQEQQQTQTNHQANSQVLSSTHTQTQNNPVTVTQNQAPINNSNTNINNITIPAPVYQAPNQYSVNYNFAQEYQVPTCTISVSNSYYNSYSNNPVTLTWSSTKAFSASISPSVGTVNPNGSTTVYPTGGTTIYTLTVHGQGGSNTCQTQVIYQAQPPVYQPPVYVPPQVTPPTAPYVALTQIPYTGFDFGPVGNSIYWAGLLSFALAAAYLVIYYKGGLAFATGTTGRRSTPRAHAATAESAKTVVSAEAPVAQTPTSMFANLPTREYRNATADAMAIIQPASSDEMPRITITRA